MAINFDSPAVSPSRADKCPVLMDVIAAKPPPPPTPTEPEDHPSEEEDHPPEAEVPPDHGPPVEEAASPMKLLKRVWVMIRTVGGELISDHGFGIEF